MRLRRSLWTSVRETAIRSVAAGSFVTLIHLPLSSDTESESSAPTTNTKSCFLSRLISPSTTYSEGSAGPFSSERANDKSISSWRTLIPSTYQENPTRNYDFVVIGYGTAGKSAVQTLQSLCPTATIAVLDPLRRPAGWNYSNTSKRGTLDFYPTRAIGLLSEEHRVEIDTGPADSCFLSYKCAALISTGSRGAPPPSYLLDPKAHARVLELRTTALPSVDYNDVESSSKAVNNRTDVNHRQHESLSLQQDTNRLPQRPYLSPEQVRRCVVQAALAGDTVAVLGSGWDALDLVVSIVSAGSKASKASKPTIVFGTSGPLSHVLPNYLSSAVAKRLHAKRIHVLDRSLVRYIAGDNRKSLYPLQLFTAKSFDFLDGKTTDVDWVVVAPEVQGHRGSGHLPTDEIPSFLVEDNNLRPWYQAWAGLSMLSSTDPSRVVCYKDDGRISVNTELSACQSLYAAGSVAKYANGLTGHATVAGSGVENAKDAGITAATNMARDFRNQTKSAFGYRNEEKRLLSPAVINPLPVWRSDLRTTEGLTRDQKTSLSEIGIVALCVGNCDSESLRTQGVWWTNQAAQQRLLGQMHNGRSDKDRNRTSLERKEPRRKTKPVYGLGVIYYLDRTGCIRGVMTWGLPFQSNNVLNKQLIDQMKSVIRTNGGIRSLETEQDQLNMSVYLGESSKRMVTIAFQSHCEDDVETQRQHGVLQSLPRPLHRYTDVRPPQVRSIGLLKRKDGHSNGILGEDLYARYEDDDIPDPPAPQPQSTGNIGSASANVEARHVWGVWDRKERRWDENESRARPPKEDPMWIRKGDEARSISQSDRIASAYNNALSAKR